MGDGGTGGRAGAGPGRARWRTWVDHPPTRAALPRTPPRSRCPPRAVRGIRKRPRRGDASGPSCCAARRSAQSGVAARFPSSVSMVACCMWRAARRCSKAAKEGEMKLRFLPRRRPGPSAAKLRWKIALRRDLEILHFELLFLFFFVPHCADTRFRTVRNATTHCAELLYSAQCGMARGGRVLRGLVHCSTGVRRTSHQL